MQSRAQTPLIRGWSHPAPALGASLGPGVSCITLEATLEGPRRCQGRALQGIRLGIYQEP